MANKRRIHADVVVVTCSYDGAIKHETAVSIDRMFSHSQSRGLTMIRQRRRGSMLPLQRQEAVDFVLEHDIRHLLFVDGDMVFPEDALTRLLNHEVDVVTGTAVTKQAPYTPAFRLLDAQGRPRVVPEIPENGKIEVAAVGCYFMLIDTRVLKQIPRPHFMGFYEKVGEDLEFVYEDWFFSKRLREAGVKIHVDCGLAIGHVGNYIYTLADYYYYNNKKIEQVAEERQEMVREFLASKSGVATNDPRRVHLPTIGPAGPAKVGDTGGR